MPTVGDRLWFVRVGSFGALLLILVLVGGWLVVDFLNERERITAERSRLAIHKSQLMNRSFGDTFLAADYLLRDVIGRVNMAQDLVYLHPDADVAKRLDALLKEKAATVTGLTDLVLFNGNCIFVATAIHPMQGSKSRQEFCNATHINPGQSLYVQYMPVEKSVSGRPVVLMSRILGSSKGVLLGGAMVVIDLEYAQKWIAAFEIDEGDVLAIVDADGTLLARNPALPEAIGRRAPPPSNQPPFGEVNGVSTFTAASPIDGRERIFGLSKQERFPFVAIVGFDKSRVLSGWYHRAWQFTVGYILLCALVLLTLRVHLATVRQREAMHTLAITDPLTGIANRRHFMDMAQREFSRARRYGNPLALLMLDIDKFKSINDRWGHPVGDRVIQELAQVMMSLVRDHDVCGRLGGEEFALVLAETESSAAQAIAERLRKMIEASASVHADDASVVRLTVSIGIALQTPDDGSVDAMLARADKALYQAKEGGRNRSVLAGV